MIMAMTMAGGPVGSGAGAKMVAFAKSKMANVDAISGSKPSIGLPAGPTCFFFLGTTGVLLAKGMSGNFIVAFAGTLLARKSCVLNIGSLTVGFLTVIFFLPPNICTPLRCGGGRRVHDVTGRRGHEGSKEQRA